MSMNICKEGAPTKAELEIIEAWRSCNNAHHKFLGLVERVKKIVECTDIDQDKHAQLNLIDSAGILFGEAGDELKAYMNSQIKYYELKEKAENAKKEKGEE